MRALFLASGQFDTSDVALDQLVAARLARQRILDRPSPPNLWIVLDEAALHRLIGTTKTMYDQLLQVADMSMRSYICVQVIPASTGANAGLGGSFYIASAEGKRDLLHMDAVEGDRGAMEHVNSHRWRKSSYSVNGGTDCVEVGSCVEGVLVRDTRDRSGPLMCFAPAAWQRFAEQVKMATPAG